MAQKTAIGSYRYPIQTTLDWPLHDETLAEALVDAAWEQARGDGTMTNELDELCQGRVSIDGSDFVVTIELM